MLVRAMKARCIEELDNSSKVAFVWREMAAKYETVIVVNDRADENEFCTRLETPC